MTYTYFPVVANYISFAQGSTVNGQVTFTPNLNVGQVALITGQTPPLGDISAPTLASITNGNLQTSPVASAPVYLPANTSDLNLSNPLQYSAAFQVTIGGQKVHVPGFVFNAQTPRTTSDAHITINTTTLTSATAAFTSNDVGAVVTVAGALPAGIVTIVSVPNSTTAVLSAQATATVTGAALSICQALDLITVTPAAANSVSGLLSVTSSEISDATTIGREILTANTGGDVLSLIGGAGSVALPFVVVAAPTGIAATDTAAIQAAHDSLPNTGGEIRCQAGQYALTAAGVTFTKTVKLVGAGPSSILWSGPGGSDGYGTMLFSNAINATAITVSADSCVIEDIGLFNNYKATGAVTSGYGILMSKADCAVLNRVMVFGYYDNVVIQAGGYWKITECFIFSPFRYGIWAKNTAALGADTGDTLIEGCTFDIRGAAANPVSAIRWETGAGLRIVNNKFNGSINNTAPNYQFATHIDCAFDGSTINAGDMFIQNNSIENSTSFGVKLSRFTGTHTMQNTQIQGNEFQNNGTSVQVGNGWVNVQISDNDFTSGTTGIDLLASSGPTVVEDNVFNSVITTKLNVSGSVAAGTKVFPQEVFGTSPAIAAVPYSDRVTGSVVPGANTTYNLGFDGSGFWANLYCSTAWLFALRLWGSTSGHNASIAANNAATADQTLTLPSPTTDTLVSRTSTDNMSNKTLISPVVNGASVTGDIIPATGNTYNLGGGSSYWNNLYALTAWVGGSLNVWTPTFSLYATLLANTAAAGNQTLTLPAPTTDTLVSRTSTDTLTNKRVTPRVVSVSNTTSWTINSDTTDFAENTGLTGAVTLNNPTGTPAQGQKLWVTLTGTASRAISYGTGFEDSTVARPTTTSGTAPLDIGFRWNSVTSKWRCVGVA